MAGDDADGSAECCDIMDHPPKIKIKMQRLMQEFRPCLVGKMKSFQTL